jgi:hypothetical protein
VTFKASSDFWSRFEMLPAAVQRQARKPYELFRQNPAHPSLQCKELESGLLSVRVSRSYRALGHRREDMIVWFWIGSHAQYDRLISYF